MLLTYFKKSDFVRLFDVKQEGIERLVSGKIKDKGDTIEKILSDGSTSFEKNRFSFRTLIFGCNDE